MNRYKTKRQNEWKVTTNRYVGFLDIMGFKDMVARNSNNYVYSLMKKVVNATQESADTFGTDESDDNIIDNVRVTTYSDSIMIYSRNDNASSLYNFNAVVAAVYEELLINEIPFKGAVAFGTMTLDFNRSIYFGQPLIDAYLLQEELVFYGVVVHASAEMKKGYKDNESVFEYLCPFKNGKSRHLTIYPVSLLIDYLEGIDDYDKIRNGVLKLRLKTSGALRKYIDNTLEYLDLIYKNSKIIIDEKRKKIESMPETDDDDDLPF